LVSGVSIFDYDVPADDTEAVVFSTLPSGKAPQIWLAPLDRSAPRKLITANGGGWPHFGPDGSVVFLRSEGVASYFVRIGRDRSGLSKVAPCPIGNVFGASPDRR
jgi:hypothetical protein